MRIEAWEDCFCAALNYFWFCGKKTNFENEYLANCWCTFFQISYGRWCIHTYVDHKYIDFVEVSWIVSKIRKAGIGKFLVSINNTVVYAPIFLAA